MSIEIGRTGKIVAGRELGRYVKVVDDRKNTGGFLVLTSSDESMEDGFDNWVEDFETLSRFFAEANWIVKWPPQVPAH